MTTFNVPDMTCGHCKAAIETAISAADASATFSFDMEARKVDITTSLENVAVAKILESEGYPSSIA